MGLVHGTNYDALVNALNYGAFKSNRNINDSGKGNTHFFDRDLGLDNYVFSDYGHPHAYRRKNPSEVEVVFDLSAFEEPGSFATEKDIADCGGVKEYLSTAAENDYFLEAVQQKLATTVAALPGADIIFGHHLSASEFASGVDGNPNTLGTNNFSTWEVKIPSIDVDKIRKVIFHDQDQYNEFIAQHGSTYNVEYVPIGEKPAYYDKEDVVSNEEGMASRSAQQFDEEIKAKLAEIPETHSRIFP